MRVPSVSPASAGGFLTQIGDRLVVAGEFKVLLVCLNTIKCGTPEGGDGLVCVASSSAAVSGNILEEYFLSFRLVSAIVYRALNVVRFLLRWDRVLLFQLTRSISLIGASGHLL